VWGRSLASVVLGFPLATAIIGIIIFLVPGDLHATTLPLLLMFFPLWVTVMSLPFLCSTGKQAWGWMGLATVLGFAILYLIKAAGLVTLPA